MPREVIVVPEPERRTFRVYVSLGEGEGGVRVFSANGGETEHVIERGQEPPMYMRIEWEIAEELGKALAPRPEATERHLDDAIAVRDRLLTMVESGAR